MPDIIQKSPVMQRFEWFSQIPGNEDSDILKEAIKRLSGNANLPDNKLLKIALDLGFYADSAAAVHFRRHWLGEPPDPDPFWPTIQDTVNKVLRKGMLKACELYRDTGLPSEVWWAISGAEGTTDWQMTVSQYNGRILVVFHTPMVPCDATLVDSQRTWVILEDDTGDVVTRAAKVPLGSELPEPGAALRKKPHKKISKKPKRRPGHGPKKKAPRAKRGKTKKRK
jgi:hypothetical protein